MATSPKPAPPLNEVVAENLRTVLFELKMTQSKLAGYTGHTRAWLSERMTSTRSFSLSDVDQIAGILDVDRDRLIRTRK